MCGIFGIWHRDGAAVNLLAVRRATQTLRHRGPDDEGYLLADTRAGRIVLCGGDNTAPELRLPSLDQFLGERFDLALGFRRLAILDLSPAGHQPMPSPDGRYWVLHNGEIYNYLELRSELAAYGHVFRTNCDTEVIPAAYAQWGPRCLSRFNGMWAFAVWDREERQLFVARDRFGVKPLYMAGTPGGVFCFASEIKALLAAGVVAFRPSRRAIAGYVAQGRFPSHSSGETFFEGVTSLPGAHSMLVSRRGSIPQRYWKLPAPRPGTGPEQARREYAELFTDAVRLRLRADVPVGTCLSGGLDSSSIVAVAGKLMRTEHAVALERLGEHQQTFSAVYDIEGAWNERPYIEQVVRATGAGGNYTFPTAARLWEEIRRLVWHQDEPFQSTSIFAQWCVMGLARERGAVVLLDGQGADEVLGGYRPFAVWLSELLRAGRIEDAFRAARDMRAATGIGLAPLMKGLLALQLPRGALRQARWMRLRQVAADAGLNADLASAWLAAEVQSIRFHGYERELSAHLARQVVEDSLPNLLRYEDRNSMAFSIEARVPFLDYRLVEYVFREAAEWRIHKGWAKWLQRVAVQDLLPSEVVWRRDKVGFETPEWHWLAASKSKAIEILSGCYVAGDYLDLNAVRRAVPMLLEQPSGTGKVWRWVNLALWLEEFKVERPPQTSNFEP